MSIVTERQPLLYSQFTSIRDFSSRGRNALEDRVTGLYCAKAVVKLSPLLYRITFTQHATQGNTHPKETYNRMRSVGKSEEQGRQPKIKLVSQPNSTQDECPGALLT
ncbi:hypothetical protein J6590_052691 [Homalodisca vitripennis]|nr:hypothetical protein J6590_052691 [Homalodisca vitripennis]